MATTSFSPYAAGRPPSASSLNRHLDLSRRICLPVHRPLASTAPLRAWGLAATPLRAAPARIAIRCGALAQIGQSEFATEVLGSELPVLVEFVADWCGPCRLISSVIEWASQEYKGRLKVVKIDHDANPELISEYKVYGLPTLIIFKNGQEVPESKREGAISKVKLKEYLDNFLESVPFVASTSRSTKALYTQISNSRSSEIRYLILDLLGPCSTSMGVQKKSVTEIKVKSTRNCNVLCQEHVLCHCVATNTSKFLTPEMIIIIMLDVLAVTSLFDK